MPIFDTLIHFFNTNPFLSGGGLLAAIGSIGVFFRKAIFYEYKRWREDDGIDENQEWFKKTASLARHVQRIWEGKYVEAKSRKEAFSYDEVKAELGLLADQLDRHASQVSREDVAPEFINLVYDTAQECRSTENCVIGIGGNSEFENQGEKAVEMAEQLEESAQHRL